MRWKGYMGQSGQVGSIHSLRLASLIFNQNARSLTERLLRQAVALLLPSCSQFLPIKYSKPLHSPLDHHTTTTSSDHLVSLPS